MLPLALALGAGSELLQPLAIAVIGGLTMALGLSLIVTPTVYMRCCEGAFGTATKGAVGNLFSLQRSEMFITLNSPKDLAPSGAKPNGGTIADVGKGDCALLQGLGVKIRTGSYKHLAPSCPLSGEATDRSSVALLV